MKFKKAQRQGRKPRAPALEEDSYDEDFGIEDEPIQLDGPKPLLDDGDEAEDSDEELRVALKEGLLKSDALNYVKEKQRPMINLVDQLKAKALKYQPLPWIETVDVTTEGGFTEVSEENDFEREMQFYKQAEQAVQRVVPKLLAMKVKVFRPTDYYAEMAKSDDHMQKVRKRLVDAQQVKERQEAIRTMREEKKYASKTNKAVLEARQKDKKVFMETLKKHRKGMKQQLDDMLSNAKKIQFDDDDDDKRVMSRGGSRGEVDRTKRKMSRNTRDKRFGFGGKKKGSKQNTKQSFDDVIKPRGSRSGGGGRGGFGGRDGRLEARKFSIFTARHVPGGSLLDVQSTSDIPEIYEKLQGSRHVIRG
ncbi:unnamed protein product, partial [Mesorhabditis spiculigera]